MTIKANATITGDKIIKGYIFILNDKVEKLESQDTVVIRGLKFNNVYTVKVIAIDEDCDVKISSTVQKNTEASVYLLNANKSADVITGGYDVWFSNSSNYNSWWIDVDYYAMTVASSGNVVTLQTKQKIDLTNVTSLVFDVSGSSNNASLINTIYVGIYDSTGANINFTKQKSVSGVNPINREQITLDVSDIQGEYYIKVSGHHGTNVSAYNTYVNIYSIEMK